MNLKYKIWLDNEGKAFGDGPYRLLKGVKTSGSLAQAAKDQNMSYSRAHGLMKSTSAKLGFPLIESQAGGNGGGGTRITGEAEELMRRYEAFSKESAASLEAIFARYFGPDAVAPAPATSPTLKQESAPKTASNFQPTLPESKPAHQSLPSKLKLLSLAEQDVISLTGAGGKSSVMYTLATELSNSGFKVLLTTTTKIFLPAHGAAHRLIVAEEDGIIDLIRQGIKPKEVVALGKGVSEGKLLGISPELVDRLAEEAVADFILVEADGAAGHPIKAPDAHEPVIPQSSTVVLHVVGLDALDMPLDEEHCHRAALAASICGLPLGAKLDGQAIAEMMLSADGGRKSLPRGTHWLPVINKVDSEADFPRASLIACALAQGGAEDVVFTSTLKGQLTVHLWNGHQA